MISLFPQMLVPLFFSEGKNVSVLDCTADRVHAHGASTHGHVLVKRPDSSRVRILLFGNQAPKVERKVLEEEDPFLFL